MDTLPPPATPRLGSVDAYRGFVMFLMMAEVLELRHLADQFPNNPTWSFLAHHQTHVEWAGCSLHDMIQPSFTFLVGTALPFSLASRTALGQSTAMRYAHAAWRSIILILLGVFLRSVGREPHGNLTTNFTFEDTLSQIGFGYFFVFVLAQFSPKWWWATLIAILVGYWGAFALFPLPGPDFDYAAAGASADWPYNFSGFASHWNKNSNPAWAFDRWFLNLLPREKPFHYNHDNYSTLSFIPTLATMILGLIAGGWLKKEATAWDKIGRLVLTGGVCLGAGYALHEFGICPIVKKIWTPSWVLYAGGWSFLILAGFYLVIDVIGFGFWAFPLRVIGMNSIAAYCMAHLFQDFLVSSMQIHLGKDFFMRWGKEYELFATGIGVLLLYWLILFWMYRRKIFLRV